MKTSGRRERMRRLIQLAGQAMIIAAPNTEGKAAAPGKGVEVRRRKMGANIKTKPAVPKVWVIQAGRGFHLLLNSATARATPTPSSQAREGSM